MHFQGANERSQTTYFDTSPAFGGENKVPRPMEVFLQAMVAYAAMNVISVLQV